MGQPVAGHFQPSRDAFAFANSWPPGPAMSIRTPVGTIGVGNAARGLCGGMVFAALDYWLARVTPPASMPAPGSPLYQFIVRRLMDSWHMPAGVARYYLWMNLPDGGFRVAPRGRAPALRGGLSQRTVERQWPQVRARLDRGQPAPLGLVTVASANPAQLSHNHQVLAYGYELAGSAVSLRVYDPNSGPDDGVSVRFAVSGPATFAHNIDIGWPVRGFFLTGYAAVLPPSAR